MSYFHSNIWSNEIHKQDERIGFIASLCLHAFLFFIGGVIFVKTAQYSVQEVPQSTTVELVEALPAPPVIEEMVPPKTIHVEIIKPQPKPLRILPKLYEVKGIGNIYFQNPPPEYPPLARQMRQEGLVMLAVDVDREGMPVQVEIKKSSGFRLLDQAAIKAVRHWKFQPGSENGIPVDSTVTIPIRFRLEK